MTQQAVSNHDSAKEDAALKFFNEVVEPTVEEFLFRESDVRRGYLASLALASMSDHYFHARPELVEKYTNVGNFRGKLRKDNFAFGQVMDVANATKHVLPVYNEQGALKKIGFEHVSVQEITVGVLRAGWPINGPTTVVEVKENDMWRLATLVETARDMWREKFAPLSETATTCRC